MLKDRITQDVCERFGMTHSEMLTYRHHQRATQCRRVIAWVLRKATMASFPQIAKELDYSSHSSAIVACRAVESNPKLLAFAEEVLASYE